MDAHLLVFSKDRAAQADQLLRSVAAHLELPHRIHLLYYASAPEFERGYELLLRDHPDVQATREQDTAVDTVLRELVDAADTTLFGILADDNILIRPVRAEDAPLQRVATDDAIVCASLRLSPRKTWSQPHARALRVPRIVDGAFDMAPRLPYPLVRRGRLVRQLKRWHRQVTHLVGLSRREHGAWGVPFSSDGNLYRADRFRAFLQRAPRLQHVTSVEPQLTKHAGLWDGPLWCAIYENERLLNLVMNNVDGQGERYPHPGHSLLEANRRYLDGERLDATAYAAGTYDACHIEVAPAFVRP